MERHHIFCEEYRRFIAENREHIDSSEVSSWSSMLIKYKNQCYFFLPDFIILQPHLECHDRNESFQGCKGNAKVHKQSCISCWFIYTCSLFIRWMELTKNVASFSTEIQKLFRSLQKDLQNKFTGVWDWVLTFRVFQIPIIQHLLQLK